MSGLWFRFKDVEDEISTLESLARSFIDPRSIGSLKQLGQDLKNIQDMPAQDKVVRWGIPRDRPLRTVLSKGEYSPDSGGGRTVYAEMSSVWEIAAGPRKRKAPPEQFLLDGLASILVTLYESGSHGGPSCELARWRIEVGDGKSPGVHFHVQLNVNDQVPFPRWLDVPRLPAFAMTPMQAFESVLAELFQDRWYKEAMRDSQSVRTWINLQRPRMLQLLEWQQKKLKEAQGGTPWVVLKKLKPEADLLLPREK